MTDFEFKELEEQVRQNEVEIRELRKEIDKLYHLIHVYIDDGK